MLEKFSATVSAKYLDVLRILASWRLVPNNMRAFLLCRLGWRIGEKSAVLWGVLPTTSSVLIGCGSIVGHNAFFDGRGSVIIEDYVRMGSFIRILTTTHPIEDGERRSIPGIDYDLVTRIGYGSWLGAGVMLLPGVTIERGCVIAAGAVVAKSTEANGLYAGVPARRIKDLIV